MFRRKPKPEVTLTEAAYARWLKACRPQPLAWFLGLPEAEQQALAAIGEAYTADLIVALGLSAQSEAAAYAVYTRVDREAGENSLLQTLSAMASAKAASASGPKYGVKPTTMSGVVSERKRNEEKAKSAATPARFLGREADA